MRTYRPEIDELRVVAVRCVVLFHLDCTILPGWFVGVDVFFVISAFLIGSILLDDIATRQFSIGRLYQRRIAHALPALILVILVTFAAASLLYSAQDMASLGVAGAVAAASFIALRLIFQGSYFVLSPDAQPLLHYWSLSLKEQFHLVFPPYLYFVARYTRHSFAITGGLALASFSLVDYRFVQAGDFGWC